MEGKGRYSTYLPTAMENGKWKMKMKIKKDFVIVFFVFFFFLCDILKRSWITPPVI